MPAPKPIECEIVDGAYRLLHREYANSTACLFLEEHRVMAEHWASQLADEWGHARPEYASSIIATTLHRRMPVR